MVALPTELKKEPIIDVVFEVRFTSSIPASNILPGLLMSQLGMGGTEMQFERLPVAEMPPHIREADENLRYVPVARITFGQTIVLIGDRSLAVSALLPYPKWPTYRQMILSVMNILHQAQFITEIERHSLKYIDVLEFGDTRDEISTVNLDLTVGGHRLADEAFQLRIEIPDRDYLKIIQVVSQAQFHMRTGDVRIGTALDVDVVLPIRLPASDYVNKLDSMLDEIHSINKKAFFDLIRNDALHKLEPVYE